MVFLLSKIVNRTLLTIFLLQFSTTFAQNYMLLYRANPTGGISLYDVDNNREKQILTGNNFIINSEPEFSENRIIFSCIMFQNKKNPINVTYMYDILTEKYKLINSKQILSKKDSLFEIIEITGNDSLIYFSSQNPISENIQIQNKKSVNDSIFYFKTDNRGDLLIVENSIETIFLKNKEFSFFDLSFSGYRYPSVSNNNEKILISYISKPAKNIFSINERSSVMQVDIKSKEINEIINLKEWIIPKYFGNNDYFYFKNVKNNKIVTLAKIDNKIKSLKHKNYSYFAVNFSDKEIIQLPYCDYCIGVKNK